MRFLPSGVKLLNPVSKKGLESRVLPPVPSARIFVTTLVCPVGSDSSLNTISLPSGDHLPAHEMPSWVSRVNPVPSAFTTYRSTQLPTPSPHGLSGGSCEKRIRSPSGEKTGSHNSSLVLGMWVICFSP